MIKEIEISVPPELLSNKDFLYSETEDLTAPLEFHPPWTVPPLLPCSAVPPITAMPPKLPSPAARRVTLASGHQADVATADEETGFNNSPSKHK